MNGRARASPRLRRRARKSRVVAADVSRAEDVDALLDRIAQGPSPLRGIVHAAGVDITAPIRTLTDADIRNVFAPKVDGAWLLHERTRGLNLNLFVCFSSIASILGSQSRAHYAAANACLDVLAAERRRLGLAATTVNWGPWKGGGMATGAHLEQFERIGNRGLRPDQAMKALDALLALDVAQASVADLDWGTFAPVYEARKPRAILREVGPESAAPAAVAEPAAGPAWVERLRAVPPEGRTAELEALLAAQVADTLGFDDSSSIPRDWSFYEIGMDSLMMADLVASLKRHLGASHAALVFEQPNVAALARSLLEKLSIAEQQTVSTAAEAPAQASPPISATATAAYSADVEREAIEFQIKAWPHRSPSLIPSRWRWMFVESARRLAVPPQIWLHRDNGTVVAHMGAIPVRLKVGEAELPTAWFVDTMVLEEYRPQALGSRLMVEAHSDQPFGLSLGQTAEMRAIQSRLGWKQVAPLQTAEFVVRAGNVLKGKLPAPFAWAAGLSVDASTALLRRLRPTRRLAVRAIDRFDERHDRLWNEVSRDFATAVVRDASYLNWKYVDQPGQDLLRVEILDRGEVKAVAVWMFRDRDANYRYRRAYLVDLVAPLSDPALMRDIIANACVTPMEAGADSLLCLHINARLTRALRGCGFHLRQPSRHLLVDPGPLSGERARPGPVRRLLVRHAGRLGH